jgi:hypothetical protein
MPVIAIVVVVVIGILLIVVCLGAAGLFVFGMRVASPPPVPVVAPSASTYVAPTAEIKMAPESETLVVQPPADLAPVDEITPDGSTETP